MKTVIIGLGNTLFSDDGAGLLVARAIKSKISDADTTVIEATAAGLDILDFIADYEKAIIIDVFETKQGEPGTVYRCDINQLSALSGESPHNIDFLRSFELGKKLGLNLPREVIIFGIEAQNIKELNEECTPCINAAIPLCVEQIMNELVPIS